jgi:hypothetical protein
MPYNFSDSNVNRFVNRLSGDWLPFELQLRILEHDRGGWPQALKGYEIVQRLRRRRRFDYLTKRSRRSAATISHLFSLLPARRQEPQL